VRVTGIAWLPIDEPSSRHKPSPACGALNMPEPPDLLGSLPSLEPPPSPAALIF
jgi:hypothetical protein